MASKKLFVVFGATGTQGGSVITSMLADPKASAEFKLRGITRDPSKPNAQALAAKGVECVTGDVNDKDSLTKALTGAHSVFAITNYWEKMDDKLEIEQGHNIADVCKAVGVQHLIWSALFDIKKLSGGKYPNVYHFDSKAHIETYIRQQNIPASFFMPGFYMSNTDTMMQPSPQPPHAYTLALPMPSSTPIPFLDTANDTGKFVKAMVMKRDQVLGKRVYAATDYYKASDVPKILEQVKPEAGKGAQFMTIDKNTYKGFLAQAGLPEFAQEELYENMAFMDEFGYFGKESLEWSLSLLDEKPTTFAEFFAQAPKWKDLK